jgi:predicted ATPase
MPDRAHVTSVDALESFRASLIVYLSKARPTLEEVSADVQRTRGWLESEQRTYWENEFRRRSRALDEAQAALFSSRISKLREISGAEQMAVQRAKRALDEADAKLRVVKQWNRVFDNRVDPLVKQMEKLHTVLANDMVKAVAYLAQVIDALHNYAGIIPSPTTGAAPAEGNTPKDSQSPVVNSQAGSTPAESNTPKPEEQP